MSQTVSPLKKADLALCRSGMYEALALGFRAPSEETMQRLVTAEQNLALAEIARALDSALADERATKLFSLVIALSQCMDARNLDELVSAYRRFFGHTAHGLVPAYETEYGEETLFQQPQQLGDLAGFYEAFGLKLNSHERVDHIACECEFLAFLTRKEAFALEERNSEMLAETRKAQRLFLRDHLARFVPAFSSLLANQDRDGFYGTLAKLCRQFILSECAQFNIQPGPEKLRLRPVNVDSEELTCGPGEELVQILTPSSQPTVTTDN